MRKLRVGLIGTGRLGQIYARILATQISECDLIAVAGHLAPVVAEQWDIPYYSLDRSEVIRHPKVEAVVIVSSTNTHCQFIQEAAFNGKAIFCEKPLTLDLEKAYALQRNLLEFPGTYLQLGFMRRYDPAYVKMKILMSEYADIGNPVMFRSTSRDKCATSLEYAKTSGGMLVDMAIHDYDLARWYFGEVKSVYAIGKCIVYDELLDINDIDNAIVTLEFQNGALGVIDVSRCAFYGYDVHSELLGSHGALRAGYFRDTAVQSFHDNLISHDVIQSFRERFDMAFFLQLQDFIRNVLEDTPATITLDDGIKALEIAVAAYESMATGKPVELAEINA